MASEEDGLLLLKRIAQLGARSVIVCAGASQRPLVERGVRELGFARERLWGSAPEALAAAVRAIVAVESGRIAAGCRPDGARRASFTDRGAVGGGHDQRVRGHPDAGRAGATAPCCQGRAALAAWTIRAGRSGVEGGGGDPGTIASDRGRLRRPRRLERPSYAMRRSPGAGRTRRHRPDRTARPDTPRPRRPRQRDAPLDVRRSLPLRLERLSTVRSPLSQHNGQKDPTHQAAA